METADKINQLIAGLLEEKKCYASILGLAKRQCEAIQKDNADALMKILREKQDIMAGISSREKIIAPIRAEWAVLKQSASAGQVLAVENAIKEIRELLEQVIKEEDSSRDVIKSKKEKVADTISKIQRGKKVNDAYSQSAKLLKNNNKFTDREG